MGNIRFDVLDLLEERDAERAAAAGDPEAEAAADRPILVEILFDGSADDLVSAGFEVRSFIDGYAAAELSPVQVRDLSEIPAVRQIRLPALLKTMLDKSVPQIKAGTAWTLGQQPLAKDAGTVIGVIDNGLDVRHKAFLDAAGKTRILRLWDQTFKAYSPPGFPFPAVYDRKGKVLGYIPTDETGMTASIARTPKSLGNQFDYGIEFTDVQINTALSAPPVPFPVPLGGNAAGQSHAHGTTTTGIAAGQAVGTIYTGVAPEAQLILVRSSFRELDVVDAANYIVAAAKAAAPGKPVVINCSIGNHIAPHNGFSALAAVFDKIMKDNPNVLFVLAAGNERDKNIHATAPLVVGDPPTTVELKINKTTDEVVIFGSYHSTAYIKCNITFPPGEKLSTVSGNWYISQLADPFQGEASTAKGPKVQINLDNYKRLPGDPDAHFTIMLSNKGGVPLGIWKFEFASEAFSDGNLPLWVDNGTTVPNVMEFLPSKSDQINLGISVQDAFRGDQAVRRPERWIRGTVSALGSCERVLTVSAYNAESSSLTISDFSNQGPCPRDLSLGLFSASSSIGKPDIAAPGEHIDAPTSIVALYGISVPGYAADDGTSAQTHSDDSPWRGSDRRVWST